MKKLFNYLLRTLLVLFLFVNIVTAFHAYKFTHFYTPGEVAIKKKEEKTGWDKTKEALLGINAVKKINTVSPDSTFQQVWLTTKNNLKLQGWYVRTDSVAKGTVILFHGHGATKSAVFGESVAFRKMGYNTFLLDFRAHGSSEGNTCTIGYYEAEDVKLAYDHFKEKGEKNIVLWGISMGAAAITKAISDYGLQPGKIILEMPFGSIIEAAEGRLRIMQLPPEPLAALITFWGGVENSFWAFNMKPSEFVKQIKSPTLLQWGRNDTRVTKGETDDIFNNIPAPKKLVVYDNSGHESLCSKENEKWIREVNNFLLH